MSGYAGIKILNINESFQETPAIKNIKCQKVLLNDHKNNISNIQKKSIIRSGSYNNEMISINSIVGTTNGFFSIFDTGSKKHNPSSHESATSCISNSSNITKFLSKSDISNFWLTTSSSSYNDRRELIGSFGIKINNIVKSESFEYLITNSNEITQKYSQKLNKIDAKETTQSIISLRANKSIKKKRLDMRLCKKPNNLMTSDLSALIPSLDDLLPTRSNIFFNEKHCSEYSIRNASISLNMNKSLNERINSTLLNLVALNQDVIVQKRVSIHSKRNKNLRYSSTIEYFDPCQIDQYIDLTTEIKSVIEKHNSLLSIASSYPESRPDSLPLNYCGISGCFCNQKLSKMNKPQLRPKKNKNVKISQRDFIDKLVNNKVNLSYG